MTNNRYTSPESQNTEYKSSWHDETSNKLGNTKQIILKQMKISPRISGARLAAILDISITAVEKNVKQLRADGLIKRVGETRLEKIIKSSVSL